MEKSRGGFGVIAGQLDKIMTVPITVLMSVYNGDRWLNESIPSVLSQTFTDFEFLIVNDGSSDSTIQIINSYAAKDERIRVIDKPNTGLADSLNQGICAARGEWIARIDSDDLCKPNRLEVQYRLAQADNALVLIGSGLIEVDDLSQRMKTYRYPSKHQKIVGCLLKMKRFFAHSSAFYRTQAVKHLGGYRLRIKRAQDFDLWLRLSEVGKIACIKEPLILLRKHSEQISHDEGGRRQLVDSRVALVSYFLRQSGGVDPVEESAEDEYAAFRQFVERGIEKDGLIEYRHFINYIKTKRSNSTLTGVWGLFPLLGRCPHFVLRYIREAIFGERLAQRLTNDWINEGGRCAE